MAIRKIKAGLVTKPSLNKFIGEEGHIFYDPRSGEMRISDGVTPGGFPLSTYKRTLSIPSWPPAYIAPDTVYKVFSPDTNVIEIWETDKDGNPYKQAGSDINLFVEASAIFVNSAGLPITPYQP